METLHPRVMRQTIKHIRSLYGNDAIDLDGGKTFRTDEVEAAYTTKFYELMLKANEDAEVSVFTEDEWEEVFKPKENPRNDYNAAWNGWLYETTGKDLEIIRATPNQYVWTLVEAEDSMFISSGKRFVNRLGYFVCERPFYNESVVGLED